MQVILREAGMTNPGDRIVLVTGNPADGPGKTAALRVVDVDDTDGGGRPPVIGPRD